jgi:hypothetical protein
MRDILFLFFALFFIVEFFILIYKRSKFKIIKATCVKTVDWVGDSQSGIKGVFNYQFNGKDYQVAENGYISSLRLKPGNKVNLYVNPENPEEIISEGALKKELILCPLGALIFIIGIIISN